MADRQFVTPSEAELLEVFGTESEAADSEGITRSLKVDTEVGDEIHVSYSPPGRSIRLQWFQNGTSVIDIYREEATRLSVETTGGTTAIDIRFESACLSGELHIQVWPTVVITDRVIT